MSEMTNGGSVAAVASDATPPSRRPVDRWRVWMVVGYYVVVVLGGSLTYYAGQPPRVWTRTAG